MERVSELKRSKTYTVPHDVGSEFVVLTLEQSCQGLQCLRLGCLRPCVSQLRTTHIPEPGSSCLQWFRTNNSQPHPLTPHPHPVITKGQYDKLFSSFCLAPSWPGLFHSLFSTPHSELAFCVSPSPINLLHGVIIVAFSGPSWSPR